MATRISYIVVFLTGLGMLFIGGRFLLSPIQAEWGYGLHLTTGQDFSFHYIKGIRDIFSGLLVCLLVLFNQRKALGVALIAAAVIPFGDLLIVLSKDYNSIQQALPHIIALLICLGTGIVLLLAKPAAAEVPVKNGFVRMVQRGRIDVDSIIESNIFPGNKTPWHYHVHFAETFTILQGRLEAGIGGRVHQLREGDTVTINPGERHYYHNIYNETCIIRTTIRPGNTDFENAMLILKGLEADGLCNRAGTPKKLADLALFIRLNNSRMTGFQKIAEPFFNYVAKRAIRNGRLDELMKRYAGQ